MNELYLLITRIFFGVGEACYVCVAPAIIHDLFIEDTKRTNYLILFNMMVPVGSGLGYVVGGWAANYFENWKMALRLTLPIGIITLILFIVLTKPVPHAYSEIMHSAKQQNEHNLTRDSVTKKSQGFVMKEKTFKQTMRDFAKNKTFVFTTVGFTAICFVLGSGTTWLPILFTRAKQIHGIEVGSGNLEGVNFLPCSSYKQSENATIDCKSKNYQSEHESVVTYFNDVKNELSSGGQMDICEDPTSHMSCQIKNNISYCQCKSEEIQLSSDVFMLFGALATLSGIAGALTGGKLSDKWKRSGNPRAESDICAIGLLFGSILLYISIVIVGNNDLRTMNWAIYWLGLTCVNFNWALVSKIVLSIVEPNEKSMANAVINTIGHLFGDASSSVLIGALADYRLLWKSDVFYLFWRILAHFD